MMDRLRNGREMGVGGSGTEGTWLTAKDLLVVHELELANKGVDVLFVGADNATNEFARVGADARQARQNSNRTDY